MNTSANLQPALQVPDVLANYAGFEQARWQPLGDGLINDTFAVDTPAGRYVLQRLNPIFDPRIHHNIFAVTEQLAARGMCTPRLVNNRAGELWTQPAAGQVWRLMTRVAGVTLQALASPQQAAAAGELVGRFHRALEGLAHPFAAIRLGVHDTAAHLATLEGALGQHAGHALYDQVAPLGQAILERARNLEPLPVLSPQICHGDLKISNIIFADARAEQPGEAVCLIDLDTLAPMPLAHELGDAWRSWCNPAREDQAQVAFEMDRFAASWEGYCRGIRRSFGAAELLALLLGPEIISLELAARFCADALNEQYFGWDRQRFERAGIHHLLRAKGQFALYEATLAVRGERAAVLRAICSAS